MHFEIGEINIICTEIERTLRFYSEILGFEVLGEEEGAYHLQAGHHLFLLLPVAEQPGTPVPYCSVPTISFDLVVDDLQAAYTYFAEQGVRPDGQLETAEGYFTIRDPDGNVIEIVADE